MFDDDRTHVRENATSQRDDGPSNARIFAGSIQFAMAVVTASRQDARHGDGADRGCLKPRIRRKNLQIPAGRPVVNVEKD